MQYQFLPHILTCLLVQTSAKQISGMRWHKNIIGERERANLVVQLAQFFYNISLFSISTGAAILQRARKFCNAAAAS